MPEKDSAGWKQFYDAQERFYDFMEEQTVLKHEKGHEAKCSVIITTPNGTERKPPRYVRSIISLNDEFEESTFHTFEELRLQMENAYDSIDKKLTIRQTDRFPHYFKDVEKINLTKNDAFKSERLKPDEWVILPDLYAVKQKEDYRVMEERESALQAACIKCQGVRFGNNLFQLSIENNSLFQFLELADHEYIQQRECTGGRYRARVYLLGEDKHGKPLQPVWVKYGLIVLNTSCPIYPIEEMGGRRRRRSNRLTEEADSIVLPGDTPTNLYKKITRAGI